MESEEGDKVTVNWNLWEENEIEYLSDKLSNSYYYLQDNPAKFPVKGKKNYQGFLGF